MRLTLKATMAITVKFLLALSLLNLALEQMIVQYIRSSQLHAHKFFQLTHKQVHEEQFYSVGKKLKLRKASERTAKTDFQWKRERTGLPFEKTTKGPPQCSNGSFCN